MNADDRAWHAAKAGRGPAYGLWRVTTEGDCEGRTLKELGVHEGYLDEIAFALSDATYYGLHFQSLDSGAYRDKAAIGNTAIVSLEINSGTWDMSREERVAYFKRLLERRPVEVKAADNHASVCLVKGRTPAEQEQFRKESARRRALSKLSPEDIEALGLK